MKVNGVFEGGGVRGVALAGAAAAALDAGYEFEQTVGTSAGALVSSLVAAGFDADDLSKSICAVQWPELLRPVTGARIPWLGRHWALLSRHGIYDSERLEEVWGGLLETKGVHTFADLRPGSLKVIATDISHSRGVVFPDGVTAYGHHAASFRVARAVRMSAAVPFLFTPVPLRDHINGDHVVMADGALTANFPISVVDKSLPVLGFRLVLDGPMHDNRHLHVRGPLSLVRAVIGAGIRARYDLPRRQEDGVAVVHVPVRNDLDFDMSGDEARAVFDHARQEASRQLADMRLTSELR